MSAQSRRLPIGMPRPNASASVQLSKRATNRYFTTPVRGVLCLICATKNSSHCARGASNARSASCIDPSRSASVTIFMPICRRNSTPSCTLIRRKRSNRWGARVGKRIKKRLKRFHPASEPTLTRQRSATDLDKGKIGLIAWAFYDWANSAFPTIILTFLFASYFTRQVARDEALGSALWGNTVAAAEIAVAVAGPVLGAIADQTGRNKRWLAAFTLICLTATTLLWFVLPSPQYLWFGLALVGIGIFGSDCANIFYNEMLPRIAAPEQVGRWSGWSWGMGYAGGLVCLVISLFVFVEPIGPWIQLDRQS